MLFKYKVIDNKGETKEGTIEAVNQDLAIASLQRRGLVLVSIQDAEKKSFLEMTVWERVPAKDLVIFSRQIATLFEAQVSALKAFNLLSENAENKLLKRQLAQVAQDIQAGSSISGALAKHKDVFSNFYINMVKAGEESGKLTETFNFLAEYLDRQYALTSKTKNALIYPAFVILTFFAVMGLMFTMVIPKLSEIIKESGQDIPVYTKVVIGLSDFFVHYGIFVLIFLVGLGAYVYSLSRKEKGQIYLDSLKLSAPAFGKLYRKLYLARIADNLETMLASGIPIVRSLEITGDVVGSRTYQEIIKDAESSVKSGSSLSGALEKHNDYIPQIMIQMIKVGEETGALSNILKTLSNFYRREVNDAVDTLVGLIEPVMIVFLGVSVGILLSSVLIPIYNIASGIS
ncbi:type II secretion system F family protein [Candidatus Nomurabacteria bacterium]|nr:type II secretion system F family protein [Candidatus Nomurabacteria bacterium]MCB9820815.1 type II secretion system F family protein [Candidatus Nomurabacteria bacterium]